MGSLSRKLAGCWGTFLAFSVGHVLAGFCTKAVLAVLTVFIAIFSCSIYCNAIAFITPTAAEGTVLVKREIACCEVRSRRKGTTISPRLWLLRKTFGRDTLAYKAIDQ